MKLTTASEQGSANKPNEDWFAASSDLIVVLDGATARTDTGCVHGVHWFAAHLGSAISGLAVDKNISITDAVSRAIEKVANLHPDCDLESPGTPSAAVSIVRLSGEIIEYFTLGDTTIAIDLLTADEPFVLTDDRVSTTALGAREEADRYPIGSPEKQAALLRMKHAELAAKNRPGGFWVAAADPDVVKHASGGQMDRAAVRAVAALTDGAARFVNMFHFTDWRGLLDTLSTAGPQDVIRRVRLAENGDPEGLRWPRNKKSDDATAVVLEL